MGEGRGVRALVEMKSRYQLKLSFGTRSSVG
jgi:hypothetical protein